MRKIIEGIQYIFKDKDWQNKLLIILAVYIGITFIGSIFNFVFRIPVEIMSSIFENNRDLNAAFNTLSGLISLGSSIFTIPLSIFLYGYLLTFVKNIKENSKSILPELNPIGDRLVQGIRIFVLLFILHLPGFLLISASLVGMILPIILIGSSQVSILVASVTGLLSFLLFIFAILLNFAFQISGGYIYMETGSIKKSINLKTVFSVISENEKQILNIFKYFIAIAILQIFMAFFSLVFLCITFVTTPAITVIGYLVRAYILGDQFKHFKQIK